MKKISLSLLIAFHSLMAFADVRLPAVIGNHMVLQQNSDVKIWGWSEPGEKIKIKGSWDTATYTAVGASNAKWSVIIKTPAAGGPYTMKINGNNVINLEDILMGETWVCSGQSNMEMSVSWGIKEYENEVASATNKSIRFFHIPRTTAEYPQEDVKAKWVVCNPEDMKRFSIVAYFFGKKLVEELKFPVGLINTSWGGTPAETWTPKQTLDSNNVLKSAAAQLKPSNGWPVLPGLTYNAMIHPLINFSIAGTIWYQGESNVGTNATYQSLFTTMINSWRSAWHKKFPFYFVQIAPFAGYGKEGNASALLREQQTKTLELPKTGMVVTSDLVDDIKDIHPKLKKDVGLRLANYALAETYNRGGTAYKSPAYQSFKIDKDKIIVSFADAEKGLMVKGSELTEFYIAGDDKIFFPATAKIKGNKVEVSSKNVKNPVAVRFGFTNSGMPNLYSKEGLPVNLFRTDDWDVSTVKVQ